MTRMSSHGRDLLASPAFEGCVLREYIDAAGHPTIGCGHKLLQSEISSGMLRIDGEQVSYSAGISREDAMRLLDQDLAMAESAVTRLVKVPLEQCRFDALVSLVFNIGVTHFTDSTLLRCLNDGNFEAAPAQFRRWCFAGGHRLQGLVNRREKEIALFEGRL